MTDLPASAAKRWRLVQSLKDSGQSSVFKVARIADGVLGVLKVPSRQRAQRERLARETRILEVISHPSVVRLLDSRLELDDTWLVTPLGVPLPEWWKTRGSRLPEIDRASKAGSISRALLSGLVTVHRQRVVHRDIKPANVVLIDDEPVLIDFGVAYTDDGDRLTELDGRAVANTFAAPPPAYYGQIDDPKPWWDCLGVAWLWGWMLTAGKPPKDNRFHWKYHRMIASPDSEGVRALAAVCSDEATAPLDAEAMLRLITTIGLDGPARLNQPDQLDFGNALRLQQENLRAETMEKQARRDRVEAAALVLGPQYESIRANLCSIARRAREQGLPVSTAALINDHPIAICLSSLKEQRAKIDLFECSVDPAKGTAFKIVLACEYRELVPTAWPLWFTLSITPGPQYSGTDILHFTDGSPRKDFAREPTSNDHFPELLMRWLREEAHWMPSAT